MPVGGEELQLAATMRHLMQQGGSLRPQFAAALRAAWTARAAPGLRRRGLADDFPLHQL